MNNEYFTEMHRLIEKAKIYERSGRDEEALKAYLEIHERFFPNTSDLYDRPAILLEKKKRFDEAIVICEKAIKLINEGKITGVKDNFQRRIDRIKARTDYQELHPNKHKNRPSAKVHVKRERKTSSFILKLKALLAEEESTAEKNAMPKAKESEKENEKDTVTTPRFVKSSAPSEDKSTKEEKTSKRHEVAYDLNNLDSEEIVNSNHLKIEKIRFEEEKEDVEEAIPAEETPAQIIPEQHTKKSSRIIQWLKNLPHLIISHIKKPNKNTLIALGVIVVFVYGLNLALSNYDRSKFQVYIDMKEFESTGSSTGNPFPVDTKDLPVITQTMIDTANKSISQMTAVKTSGVIVQKNVVGFIIMLNPGASSAEAKDAAETYVRALSSAAAAENKDLIGPTPLTYGTLYDSYGVLVVAGEDAQHILLKGTKNPKSLIFNWKK